MFCRLAVALMVVFGVVTTAQAQEILVSREADDEGSVANIVIAGSETVLAKFRFTAVGGDVTVNNMMFAVTSSPDPSVITGDAADDIFALRLYDGSVLISETYPVSMTGLTTAGEVFVMDLGWNIAANSSRILTVKGLVNFIAAGADSGSSVFIHLLDERFEAWGKDIAITSFRGGPVSGREKVVYKTKPTISVLKMWDKLGAGEVPVMRFRIAADSAEDVSWKKITLQVSMTGATMSAVDAAPGTTGNVKLKELTVTNSNLNISSPARRAGRFPVALPDLFR